MTQLNLLFLLYASAAGFVFHVSRPNTSSGLCVTNERKQDYSEVLPLYNLSSADELVPDDEASWTDAWILDNLNLFEGWSEGLGAGIITVVTPGSAKYKFLYQNSVGFMVFMQAANMTIVFTKTEKLRDSSGFKFHFGVINKGAKRTWAEYCSRLDTAKESCKELSFLKEPSGEVRQEFYQQGGILQDGEKWIKIRIHFSPIQNDGVMMVYNFHQRAVGWELKINGSFKYAFARSYGQPGVIKIPSEITVSPYGDIDTSSNNRMTRIMKAGRDYRICLELGNMLDCSVGDIWGRFYALELGPAGQIRQGNIICIPKISNRLDFRVDRDGYYKVDLLNISAEFTYVTLCNELAMDIIKPAIACTIFSNPTGRRSEQWKIDTIFPTGKLNSSLEVPLTVGEVQQICAALGIQPEMDTFEKLSFCGVWGCKLLRCP